MIKSFADDLTEKIYLGGRLNKKERKAIGDLNRTLMKRMKNQQNSVPRGPTNAACAIVADTIQHHGMNCTAYHKKAKDIVAEVTPLKQSA